MPIEQHLPESCLDEVNPQEKPNPPAGGHDASEGNRPMNQEKFEQIKQKILSIGDLPTLPHVAMDVSRLANSPSSSMSDIVRIIYNDPSLTAKMLKVANSAFYGMPKRIESLNMALVILGMREINSLVTSICIFKAFPMLPGRPTFDRERFWEHSAGCGEIAKVIAHKLSVRVYGVEFTAGLLHDIGKIVLDQYFHEDFVQVLELSQRENLPMVEAEKRILGVAHTQLGAWLSSVWNLPPNLVDAIVYHHDPLNSKDHRTLCALIHLADAFCKTAGIGFSGDVAGTSFVDNPAWSILKMVNPQIGEIDLEQFTLELENSVERAREFVRIASQ
jgi:putative nucleotidyltransferase with HDIG domain